MVQQAEKWIASRSLSSGARSRDPLARNDGEIREMNMTIPYAEIGITTNFSFLRGGSHPQDYVHQASALGLAAIGIADHNTLAGIVRAYSELENPEVSHKPKLLIGARIVFLDRTPDILVYPRD